MKIYITKTKINHTELDELDYELQNEFDYDEYKHDDFVEIKVDHGYSDCEVVNIDTLIDRLISIKNAGATHVEVDYHSDHIAYDITGYKIELSSQDLIDKYENSLRKEKTKISRT